MSDWLAIHPKVFGGLIVAVILVLGHTALKDAGVDVTPTWQTLLPLLTAYMIPSNGVAK